MSVSRYIRDTRGGALILHDPAAVAEFKTRRTVMQEIQSLKADINTLKTELEAVKRALTTPQKSE
jgi:hypothetical protein